MYGGQSGTRTIKNFSWYWYWESLKKSHTGTIVQVNINGKSDWIKYTPELIKYYCSLKPDYKITYVIPIAIEAEDFID